MVNVRFSWITALLFLTASASYAQEFRAGITGIVKDAQGAAMPKASVEVVNLETNDVNHAVTNDSGYYAVPALAIGYYRVTVTATGFKKAERNRMELRSGDQVQLDFALEVGAVQETIEVSSEAELLQTSRELPHRHRAFRFHSAATQHPAHAEHSLSHHPLSQGS